MNLRLCLRFIIIIRNSCEPTLLAHEDRRTVVQVHHWVPHFLAIHKWKLNLREGNSTSHSSQVGLIPGIIRSKGALANVVSCTWQTGLSTMPIFTHMKSLDFHSGTHCRWPC